MSPRPDLDLLVALDALLQTGSVTRAAERLALTPSAASRALARAREAFGDPLLVRAGREMVLTPRARDLRDRVHAVVAEAQAVYAPPEAFDPSGLERTFTVRATDVLAPFLAGVLLAALRAEAPRVSLRLASEGDEGVGPLREGAVDLDVGVAGELGPEVIVGTLFEDAFVGVARTGHPLLAGEVTAERFAGAVHVSVSRRGRARGPIDDALGARGLSRDVALVVPSFGAAFAACAGSDLVSAAPASAVAMARPGLAPFALPFPTPPVRVVQAWHPRFSADPAHRWFRETVRSAARASGTE